MRTVTVITVLLLTLSGCGGLQKEPSNYSQIWADTQNCAGLTASKPVAVIVPDVFWDVAKDGNNGYYNYATNVIMIRESEQRDRNLVAHEIVHHLIYINYRSEDRKHTNNLFNKCGYAN